MKCKYAYNLVEVSYEICYVVQLRKGQYLGLS